jgi:hypothetical protein
MKGEKKGSIFNKTSDEEKNLIELCEPDEFIYIKSKLESSTPTIKAIPKKHIQIMEVSFVNSDGDFHGVNISLTVECHGNLEIIYIKDLVLGISYATQLKNELAEYLKAK